MVLTGVNIGDFGNGTSENFYGLIQELDKIEGIERFRISSIEPDLLNSDIIEFVSRSNKFVPHFHIPLQSGSDNLLSKMRRRYDSELYIERVTAIKNTMPNACIGADVIVGFPGETDEEFNKTYQLLLNLPLSYLHVFTYSERNNTTAVRMEDVIPIKTRKERSNILRILSEKKKKAFYLSQVNQQEKVLFEETEEYGMMFGFTSNYIKVKTEFNPLLINRTTRIEMKEIDRDGIMKINYN